MKSAMQILGQTYVNRSEIAKVMNVSRAVANRTFAIANMIDDDELPNRTYPNKVRLSVVLRIHKKTYAELYRQIKSTPETGQRTDVQKRKA